MSLTTSIHALDDAGVEDRWNAICQRSPLRTPFCTSRFLRAAASASAGLHTRIHFVADGAEDVAALALHWKRRGPYTEIVVPPFTAYSAFVQADAMCESGVHARTSTMERLLASIEAGYDVVRIHLPPTLTDLRTAVWRGWSIRPLYTYVRDLDPEADLDAGWSAGTTRTFRKGSEAYEMVDPGSAACASLCIESYERRRRRAPLSFDRLQKMIDDLAEAGCVLRFGARRKESGEVEASVAVLIDDRNAGYWVAGGQPGAAMTVLVGHLLQDLAGRGVRTFDFLGANTPSIAEFKRRFGCRLVRYDRLSCFTRKELKLLHALKQILH